MRGECSTDEFVRESVRGTGPSGTWHIHSYVDQRHRLGQIGDDLFNAIKKSLARVSLEKREREFGNTVELWPVDTSKPHDAFPIRTAPIGAPAGPVPANDPQAPAPASPVDETSALACPSADGVQPGFVLGGRYLLDSEIGSGGMGTVFRAVDRRAPLPSQSARRIALKVLRDRRGEQADVRVRLRREFHCTQTLSHPNIIKVFDLECDGDPAFYTMELLEGESLHRLLARTQPAGLPRPYAWAIIRAVGSALAHAHSRNIIHGDLKPQNVMVTQGGEVRVLDFGSSRTSDNEGAEPAILTATPPYASCDVLEGGRPDACDDLYSLACLSHELLCGRHPFDSRNAIQARAANEHPVRPDGLTSQAWQALQAGLSWSRAERSIPVSEWLANLGVDIGPQSLPSFSPAPAGWRERLRAAPWRDFRMPLGAVAVGLILLAALFRHPHEFPTQAPAAKIVRAPVAPQVLAATPLDTARPVTPLAAPQQVPAPASPAPAQTAAPVRPAPARPRSSVKPSVTLVVRHSRADPRMNFVEVHVRGNETAREFSWWTEDGSARAGVDFVAQARTHRPFTRQRRTAALFVRLLPGSGSRRGAATFYVNIAGPQGTSTGIARTAIELRAKSDR